MAIATLFAGPAFAAECPITNAARTAVDAECTIETIETCMHNDPVEAEKVLRAALGDGTDPVPLYLLGRYYSEAPPLFRNPVMAEWYFRRAATLGYEPAITAYENPDPAPTRIDVVETTTPASPRQPLNVPDPPSTLAGTELTLDEVMAASFGAGFCTEGQLLAIVSIAIAESSLFSEARNWKPENGLRPATDEIGVQGPPEVWIDGRQMHSDRGIWQISSLTWPGITDAVADDPRAAAAAIFELSVQGTDFSPWDSFVRGTAQLYYDRHYDGYPPLRPIVQAFLAAQP